MVAAPRITGTTAPGIKLVGDKKLIKALETVPKNVYKKHLRRIIRREGAVMAKTATTPLTCTRSTYSQPSRLTSRRCLPVARTRTSSPDSWVLSTAISEPPSESDTLPSVAARR